MSYPHHGTKDAFGAFVPGPPVFAAGALSGTLSGWSFAAKDLFDIAGLVTGCGNSDWAASHPPAVRHAAAVQLLLDGGATLVGRTITDEISLGLLGRNQLQGTPINPRAPDRLPGGSSSGSAAAVAGGLCDVALGTDSGGSIRVPASFTGLYGLRPTHGRVSVAGMMTQAPSFDTAGAFARTPEALECVCHLLLDGSGAVGQVAGLLIADDAFALADPAVAEALAPAVARLRAAVPATRQVTLAAEGLPHWSKRQRRLQQAEFHATFRDWVDAYNPRFSFEVARSIALGALIQETDLVGDQAFRRDVTARLTGLLDGRFLLCLPTAPILPPLRGLTLSAMSSAVERLCLLTGIAGLTGLPQINLPLAESDGLPAGLSLVGWPGGDEVLLHFARMLSEI